MIHSLTRRAFLGTALGAAGLAGQSRTPHAGGFGQRSWSRPPAFSVVPVVGDGKWIWNKPPEGQTGYLEPRSYKVQVGIELEGVGDAGRVLASTPAPIACGEQKIEAESIETAGCQAALRTLADGARQLLVSAPQLVRGQVARAVATFSLTLYKQYHGYARDQFPAEQPKLPADVRQAYLGSSPGIQTRDAAVRKLHAELSAGLSHPWDLAQRFAEWIPKNIRPQIGSYTSVTEAVENRRGDCEEMAGLFVSLCRLSEIPARLVWIPNHAFAEFYLIDSQGQGHWLPAHTACYFWFGWTGAHELVLQKGDNLRIPERGAKRFRLQEDWLQWAGRQPRARYLGEATPQAGSDQPDPGPGARRKDAKGEWAVVGSHPLDKYQRR